MSTYPITAIGKTAQEIIREQQTATVIGLTSRGIFCATGCGQVIFLSYERWRGPLTLNLDLSTEIPIDLRYLRKEQRSHPQIFDRLNIGRVVQFSPENIRFEGEDITIKTAGAPIWSTDMRPLQRAGLADARSRLENVARRVLLEGSGKGWIGCISPWVGENFYGEKDLELLRVDVELQHLADLFREGNSEGILLLIGHLLGRGAGLTPSGDDFVIGLLLGLRVAQNITPFWSVISAISECLLLKAGQKTTSLAANLIACALLGQADERLVTALEGILWGSLPAAECASRLIDYGGSSGGDTLLGMAMALSLE